MSNPPPPYVADGHKHIFSISLLIVIPFTSKKNSRVIISYYPHAYFIVNVFLWTPTWLRFRFSDAWCISHIYYSYNDSTHDNTYNNIYDNTYTNIIFIWLLYRNWRATLLATWTIRTALWLFYRIYEYLKHTFLDYFYRNSPRYKWTWLMKWI